MSPIFAGVEFTTEGIAIIGVLLSTVLGGLVYLHKQKEANQKAHEDFMKLQYERQLADKDKLLADEKSNTKSFKDIAEEALKVAEKELKPRLKPALAAVVPESNSPPTEEQQETADIQTLRARVVAVKLASDIVSTGEIVATETVGKLLEEIKQVKKEVTKAVPVTVSANADGTILDVSQSAATMFYYQREELVGQNVAILIPDRYLPKHTEGMRAIQDKGIPSWKEKTITGHGRRRDGVEEPVSVTLTWYVGEKETPIIVATIRRESIEEKVDELGRAVEAVPDKVVEKIKETPEKAP